ncbi:hypothetical protein lbkm_1550 [Lachnospiraceae bacterium KM106-2]|nr:hypothetical protein lbkm_1550 [Lachnospiraceae bacterium KM106-2]
MNKKNDVEVIINKKRYVLCGYESGDYLQKVATYLNGKHEELSAEESYQSLDAEMRNLLLDINIADDYFKAMKQIEQMEKDKESCNDDLFELRHDVIAKQTKIEENQKQIGELKKENEEAKMKIVQLEAELKNFKHGNKK